MNKATAVSWITGLLVLLLAGAIAGQEPVPSIEEGAAFGETVDVHLVTVEVSVKPLLGERSLMNLEAEDFEVFEDGELRQITHFERIRDGRSDREESPALESTVAVETEEPQEIPQYVVLSFDLSSLGWIDLQQSIDAAAEFVRANEKSTTRWSVVLISSSAEVLLPFTSNVEQVSSALSSLAGLRTGLPVQGWAGPFATLGEETAPEAPTETEAERRDGLQSVEQLVDNVDSRLALIRGRALLRSLNELFRGWSSLAGSKSMVMYYRLGPTADLSSTPAIMDSHELHDEVETVARWASAAGFTFFAADATGLSHPEWGGVSLVDSHSMAHSLAVETGGRHLSLNDRSRILELAAEQSRNFYRISYQVARGPDGREHEVEVRLRRPGLHRVRHPESYLDLTPRERVLSQLRTSANIPKTADRLPVSLVVSVAPADGERMPLRASIRVPSERLGLLWDEDRQSGKVEFFLAVYDPDGHLIALDSEVRSHDPEEGVEGPVVQTFSTELPIGNYTIAMAALDTVDGNIGMDFARIHP